MKRKIFGIISFFVVVNVLVTLLFAYWQKPIAVDDFYANLIIGLNEIDQLIVNTEIDNQDIMVIEDKITTLQNDIRSQVAITYDNTPIYYLLINIFCIFIVFLYIYIAMIRPFDKMELYAKAVAEGNFDTPLAYERANYFGAFTWAFDHMRREIKKARTAEQEAIENNKTVIATFSHDIRTPIASIRAYVEGLEANMDSTIEKRTRYTKVIIKKCDEVARLTDDLFLHSISDLDRLRILPEKVELSSFLLEVLKELKNEQNDLDFEIELLNKEIIVEIDRGRFQQAIENIINNARKYANTTISINLLINENQVEVTFQDYGNGIADEDIPFIFQKFYRGKNSKEVKGSGLGLYIAKYIMNKMNGDIKLQNTNMGLNVKLYLSIDEIDTINT